LRTIGEAIVTSRIRRLALVLVTLSTCTLWCIPIAAAAPEQPWRDPNQPPGQRADELLAAMTFDQKVAVALGDFGPVASLGVPPLTWADGPNGIRAPGTTAFPSAQTLASTFDRDLAHAYGAAIAAEAHAKGFNLWFGPAMDIARTPLAGRQPENLGEDPFLAGETAAEEVVGAKNSHVIATLKHYVGNNQDYGRLGLPIGSPGVNDIVSRRALQEIYEAPFKDAVRSGGADAAMCSYNRVNGVQACQSTVVLGDLKGSGFDGFVLPDFIFAVRDQLAATLAGVDLPAIPGDPVTPPRTADMFTSGQVSMARLDDIVHRIVFAMFDSGAFDNPVPPPADNVSSPDHVQLATRVSEAGMVLLKNDRRALPLASPGPESIAVIGPAGSDAIFVTGGSASVPVDPTGSVTPLAGITARAGPDVKINVAQGTLGDVPLPTIVPSDVLTPSAGNGPGLLGTYWNNGELAGTPALTRVDPTVDLSAAPAGVGPLWSARWTGTLTPPESGLYRFSLTQAGIARLFVDDKLIASGYREATQFVAGPAYPVQGAINLKEGKPVSIRIEYTSKAQLFGAQIHFAWQAPSTSGIAAAVEAARKSDVAIVFANNAQGEGMDRSALALPGDQDQLITAVSQANRRTIVVLNTGGPVLMPWLPRVEAVLQAWYAGQQFGSALAAVLFGDSDPGGRLPVTFPATEEQGPAPPSQPERYPGVNGDERYDEGIYVCYRWYDQFHQQPLFPFGYGLSYADFRFSDLQVNVDRERDTVLASARVTNTSDRPGSTVAQAYLASPKSADEPPVQLKGYQKIALDPGESAVVTFRLASDDLAYFNESLNQPVVADGRYEFFVGSSSRDLQDHASFELG
jgi:beta-glucosidase